MHFVGQKHKHQRNVKLGIHVAPEQTPYIRVLDKVTFFVGIFGSLAVAPQIYSIYSTQSAVGVSLTAWLLIFIVAFPWILYGIAHKDKVLIVSFLLTEIANGAVLLGILLYR